jgi:hypothetical protein
MGPYQPSSPQDQEHYFRLGLDWLLSGIAGSVG